MRLISVLIAIFVITVQLISANTHMERGEPAENAKEHQFYIGFKSNQPLAKCTKTISRFSGTVIEELRDFDYPVFLVKVENSLSPHLFRKQILPKIEKQNGVHFVSMKRNDIQTLPMMEVESASIHRRGSLRISAPKNISYDFTKSTGFKNTYHEILQRHLPGLRSQISHRHVNLPDIYAVFELDLNREGEVKQVRILANNIMNPDIRKRLKEKIYSWKDFPRRSNDDLVTLRFKFKAQ